MTNLIGGVILGITISFIVHGLYHDFFVVPPKKARRR